jgi:hypothetical protein
METIYLPGFILEWLVHWSGTGLKGNCTHKKRLTSKVISLFLGNPFDQDNAKRRLEIRFMMRTLEYKITTKLDRTKLDKETTFIQHEDSAGVLLNGVNHIYS